MCQRSHRTSNPSAWQQFTASSAQVNVCGEMWSLPKRYKVCKFLGKGSCGVVVSAMDAARDNEIVAIKRIRNLFDNLTVRVRLPQVLS
jgi:hypothetical protein